MALRLAARLIPHGQLIAHVASCRVHTHSEIGRPARNTLDSSVITRAGALSGHRHTGHVDRLHQTDGVGQEVKGAPIPRERGGESSFDSDTSVLGDFSGLSGAMNALIVIVDPQRQPALMFSRRQLSDAGGALRIESFDPQLRSSRTAKTFQTLASSPTVCSRSTFALPATPQSACQRWRRRGQLGGST